MDDRVQDSIDKMLGLKEWPAVLFLKDEYDELLSEKHIIVRAETFGEARDKARTLLGKLIDNAPNCSSTKSFGQML